MASIPALPGNGCRGVIEDPVTGDTEPDIRFKCLKGVDAQEQDIFTCTTMKQFSVKCPKVNFLCNDRSTAWVAAVTVCNQRLF